MTIACFCINNVPFKNKKNINNSRIKVKCKKDFYIENRFKNQYQNKKL